MYDKYGNKRYSRPASGTESVNNSREESGFATTGNDRSGSARSSKAIRISNARKYG